jgi:hypothetical protein
VESATAAHAMPDAGRQALAGRQTWRQRLQQRPAGGRKMLLVTSVIALLVIGVCGASGLALLSHGSVPVVGAGITSPFGDATNTVAGQTPGSTSTTGSGGTTVHSSATATAGAVAMATSTAEGTPAATPTDTTAPGAPTPTALPSPTSVPVPPSNMAFSSTTITMSPYSTNNKDCGGRQTITNQSAQTISWQWKTMQPPPNPGLQYFIDSNGGSYGPLKGMPKQSNLAAGQSSTLTVIMNCGPQSFFTVEVTDSVGDQFTIYLQMS